MATPPVLALLRLRTAARKVVPLIEQKVEELDIEAPAVGGEAGTALASSIKIPTKKEIAALAVELCESFTRKHVFEMFIKAYNATEIKLIDFVGLGGSASSDPDATARDVSYLNPIADATDLNIEDLEAKAQSMLSEHTGVNVEEMQSKATELAAEADGIQGEVDGLSTKATAVKGQVSGLPSK